MKIRFYANLEKPEAAECSAALSVRAHELGLKPVERGVADAVVALGGDGTILRAVHEFPETPVLGFNLGGLGYLAAVGRDDFESALAALAAGRYSVAERRMLKVEKAGASAAVALNDVVLSREMSGRSVRIDLSADGHEVTSYLADGLIFATPTGSTAYSLSAGGPVVDPTIETVLLTPICTHSLFARSLLFRPEKTFRVEIRNPELCRPLLSCDGEETLHIAPGSTFEIRRAHRNCKIIRIKAESFTDTLSRKMVERRV